MGLRCAHSAKASANIRTLFISRKYFSHKYLISRIFTHFRISCRCRFDGPVYGIELLVERKVACRHNYGGVLSPVDGGKEFMDSFGLHRHIDRIFVDDIDKLLLGNIDRTHHEFGDVIRLHPFHVVHRRDLWQTESLAGLAVTVEIRDV